MRHLRLHQIDALALFALFLALYLLSFKGIFTAIDELALYARTESLVQWGNFDVPQLRFATFHNPVGAQEMGFPLLAAPFYWLAQQLDWLHRVHMVMLLNPLVTAVTGAILYLTGRQLGYGRNATLIAAFTFGLASLAWPYAQTFYREPMVALGWSLALYALVRWHTGGHNRWAGLGVLMLVLMVPIKATAFIALPCLLLPFAAARLPRRHFLLVLVVVLVGALLLFQLVAALRYGSMAAALGRITNQDMLLIVQRVYGQLLSPGKGLLFYMPAALVVVAGLVPLWRRQWPTALGIIAVTLATALGYATYNTWYGGLSWGPRFLVPTLPLLLLAVAPAWEAARGWARRLPLALLLLASLLMQLAVVTANWWPGFLPLFTSGPNPENNAGLDLTRLDLSPPLVQVANWQPSYLNLLWLHQPPYRELVFHAGLGLWLAAAVVGVLLCWWGAARRRWPWPLLGLPLLLALLGLLRWGPSAMPDLELVTAVEGREIAAWISDVPSEPYTLVTVSNNFQNYFYLGYLQGRFRHYWYSPAQANGFDVTAASSPWVTLVVDRRHMSPEHSGQEMAWWLNDRFYRADSQWVGQYELIRYANFPQADWQSQPRALRFGDAFAIEQVALSQTRLRPGDALGVALTIRRVGELPDFHHLFVHLLKTDFSYQVNGLDGPVKYGYALTVPWELGHAYEEKRGLILPPDTPPGTYAVIVGFDTPGGVLTAVPAANEEATFAILGEVVVE